MRFNPSNNRYVRLGLVWFLAFFFAMLALMYINRFLQAPLGVLLLIGGLGCAMLVYRFERYIL